jgi:hypothetical protein
MMSPRSLWLSLAVCAIAYGGPALAQDCDADGTVASGGAAATDSTTATTLGTGAACQTEEGTSKTIGSGGSAAAVDGKADSDTKVVENPNKLKAMSRARAQDGGEWSKSRTKTTVNDDGLASTTRTMSHVPGSAPVKSTTDVDVELGGEASLRGSADATTGAAGACPPGQQGKARC